ncbi:lytic transglycosylase domain-containing protein [Rhodopseudomonas palustris]|uniref:Lytic transglycosylase, catalytic n=1 Tax=Rhodopseudomonas palustris (strain BisB18) TaxID=316056 RepID=Q20ZK5_RHOPB
MLPSDRILSVFSVRDLNAGHSFLPANARIAIVRMTGAKRRSGRGISGLQPKAAIIRLRRRLAGTMVWIFAILASSLSCNGVACADQPARGTQTASQPLADSLAPFITEASERFAIPERWIRAVMRAESSGKMRARSAKGAIGLMQIMPETWTELRTRYGLGADPYDPHDNILAGAAYLRELHDRYGMAGFIAAYNAGPRRYDDHLATGRSLPDETQAYVAAIMPMIGIELYAVGSGVITTSLTVARCPLFIMRPASNSTAGRTSSDVRPDGSLSTRAVVDLSALVPQSSNLFARSASWVRP